MVAEISSEGENAIDHYRRLPEMTDPWMFDQIDDSIFNDQNDNKPEQ